MDIKIAGIVKESITDGPGVRLAIFTQGCPHKCIGCHNPDTHDFDGGETVKTEDIALKMRKNPLLDGITLTGGEPFSQAKACVELAKSAHAQKLNVVTYTGYLYEMLIAENNKEWQNLLDETDILVDGPFILEKRKLSLIFRGSENQRIINVKESKSKGKIVEIEF